MAVNSVVLLNSFADDVVRLFVSSAHIFIGGTTRGYRVQDASISVAKFTRIITQSTKTDDHEKLLKELKYGNQISAKANKL